MRVVVLGIRGMPNVQGGVETHAEHLYTRLAALGCDVEVLVRAPFVRRDVRSVGPVRIRRIWSPRRPGFEALLHSFLGVLYAGFVRPDIIHIHAVGPAVVTPIARLLGLRVVVTHHGPDYDRDKWGSFARLVLRAGERMGMKYSHARIAISKVIAELIRSQYGRESDLIPNGVVPIGAPPGVEHLQRFGLQPGKYFLQVSRLVPEKRQLDLLAAYAAARPSGWKLALVGAVGSDPYSREVEAAARSCGAVLTGFLNGIPLAQVYSHAGAFVLPSSHEGLPIALLEALSYGLPVLASNIPANRELGLDERCYFPVGDTAALAGNLARYAETPQDEASREARRRWVAENFDWNRIAAQTLAVYQRLMLRDPSRPVSNSNQ